MADSAIATWADKAWAPRSAWAGIVEAGQIGAGGTPGVTARTVEGYGLATLIAPEGASAGLADAVGGRLGLTLPATPAASASPTHTILWAGPGQSLLRARDKAGFSDLLAALSPHAAVADQSEARAALTLSGPRIRDALAKGCMVDLHPRAFPIGTVALTSIAYIGVHLWRAEDGPDGPVFEIMVARSMAGSFWSWFSASVAEYGCAVSTGRG
ncbi:MAG: sarcosine oxidase subunit gamma [Chelatococcus sp.]|nr:MAG: sarcosine oxidase subunit gamma [Chelatococcus sp.]